MDPKANQSRARRSALFRLACMSLFAGSTAFTSHAHHPNRLQTQGSIFGVKKSEGFISGRRVSSLMAVQGAQSLPKLSQEEESELLRQAVELRRIQNLELELAQLSLTRDSMPLLSVRAEAAGYGEELELYEDAKYDGQKARELLVTRNMGLVRYCVKQIMGKRQGKRLNSLSNEDLVQEGAIGLARAVDKWNPAIGGRFSTYAVYWIRAAVLRCIAERDDMLKVPNHISEGITKINKAARNLGVDLNNGVTGEIWKEAKAAKKLAEAAGLSERNFELAMKVRSRRYSGGYVAFESWMQKGENMISDVVTLQGDQELTSLETEHLRSTLATFLKPKEIEALSWRYGLVEEDSNSTEETPAEKANRYAMEAEAKLFKKKQPVEEIASKGRWGEAMSFKEVGNKMQVSAEYGRRLCHAALAKLREAADDGRLEPGLLC